MRKQIISLALAILVLSFFACDLTIPSAIEIKGTPEIRFGANLDIGDLLKDMVDGLFDNFSGSGDGPKFIKCTNTDINTFIIYSVVLEQPIVGDEFNNLSEAVNLLGGSHSTPASIDLISGVTPIEIPSIDFSEFLGGFSFADFKANMYISGSSIVNALTVELDINGEKISRKGNKSSGLKNVVEYSETNLPEGIEIPFTFDGNEITIVPRVYIEADTVINSAMLSNPTILIEIAIWLPLVLTADNDGAKFEFPNLFSGSDLFGRESPEDPNPVGDIVEWLSLEIKLSGTNPFTNAKLVVESKPAGQTPIVIETPFGGNSLNFKIDESDMEKINSSYPFIPEISLRFDQGGKLSLPRSFKATEFAFIARLGFKIDL